MIGRVKGRGLAGLLFRTSLGIVGVNVGGKREEGKGKREKGRGKREEGRGKRKEGRGKRGKKKRGLGQGEGGVAFVISWKCIRSLNGDCSLLYQMIGIEIA
jgi:hypothetical protein